MNDRELLELAAKAAGVNVSRYQGPCEYYIEWGIFPVGACDHTEFWNPLTDDGDALRLAVLLNIDTRRSNCKQFAIAFKAHFTQVNELIGVNPYVATRRSIVRAAAEIGKVL